MHTLSPDTHSKVEQLHIELLRKAPIFRRLQMVTSLVKTTRQLSWQGICERYPHDTEEARIERYLTLLYNDNVLARKVASLTCAEKESRYEMKIPDIIEDTHKVIKAFEKTSIAYHMD